MATRTVTKQGVGEVILKTRWWRPKKVTQVLFRPEGTHTTHRVPEEAVESLMGATSREDAMAVLRRHTA